MELHLLLPHTVQTCLVIHVTYIGQSPSYICDTVLPDRWDLSHHQQHLAGTTIPRTDKQFGEMVSGDP